MRTINVKLVGMSPLLMHRYPLEQTKKPEMLSREEQAEMSAYRGEDGCLFIPGVAFQSAFINAATYSKGKGKSSLQKNTVAGLFVEEFALPLGVKTYMIDSRRVVNKATKGAIIRHRPRIENWSVDIHLNYDETLLRESEVRQIVDDAGRRVGVLDYRPWCKGPFGRFQVNHWQVMK